MQKTYGPWKEHVQFIYERERKREVTNACSCMLIANAPFVHAGGRLIDCDSAVAWQLLICVSVRVCKRYIWVLAVMRHA